MNHVAAFLLRMLREGAIEVAHKAPNRPASECAMRAAYQLGRAALNYEAAHE